MIFTVFLFFNIHAARQYRPTPSMQPMVLCIKSSNSAKPRLVTSCNTSMEMDKAIPVSSTVRGFIFLKAIPNRRPMGMKRMMFKKFSASKRKFPVSHKII